MHTIRKNGRVALAVTALLLAGLSVETWMRPRSAAAEPFHASVRALAEQAPSRIGDWVGTDVPTPAEAIKLLKPNVILSRRFYNPKSGRAATFLLVHCRDARDLYGHYPPVCYPANGMELRTAEPADWVVADVPIAGKLYKFDERSMGDGGKLVANFLIVPGSYVPDMDAVYNQAGDYTMRHFGAAQVQVVYHDPLQWTSREREDAFQEFVAAHLPLLEQIRNGALKP